jgi:hypothetical protein
LPVVLALLLECDSPKLFFSQRCSKLLTGDTNSYPDLV